MRMRYRGFTLVEVLIVIAIATVLLSIVTIALSGSRMKARDGVRVADIRRIQIALEHFYDACGQYPPNITTLTFSEGCTGSTNLASFLPQVLTDPTNSAPYTYRYYAEGPSGTKCLAYHIAARLEGTNSALGEDSDVTDSSTISAFTNTCGSSGTAFDGVDDEIVGGSGADIMFDGTSNL